MRRLLVTLWIGLLLAPTAPAAAKRAKKERLVLSSGIYFASGTATLDKKSSRRALDEAARILKSRKKMKIRIEVHTDSRGSSAYNRKISQQRADAIAKALAKRGVEARRLTAKGYGEDRPIADNRTAAGRAKNRRIELVIVGRGAQP